MKSKRAVPRSAQVAASLLVVAFATHVLAYEEFPPPPPHPYSFSEEPGFTKAIVVVVERARAGIPQHVSIVLAADDAWAREALRTARVRGLSYDSEERRAEERSALEALHKELEAIKEEVFPGGRLGNMVLANGAHVLGSVSLSLPDLDALKQLLAHPRVRSVGPVVAVDLITGATH